MARSTELLRKLDADHFGTVVASSPKKLREEVFRRAGIKNRGGAFALTTSGKNEVRVKKLRAVILGGHELEDELGEELIRNYLYTRRALLAEALDFFEVEHEDGLTDADLDFISDLPPEKGSQLKDLLARNHSEADVELYLAFMNVPTA